MVALAQVLSYLKLYELPQGGAVSPGLIPIFFYCVRWGPGPSLLMSAAYAVLQLMLDGAYAWGWQSMLMDYLLAFTALGLGGLCWKWKGGCYWGGLVGTAGRFVFNYLAGATLWASQMPEEFFGMTMTTPWFYSALYNGFYAVLNLLIVWVVFFLMRRTALRRYLAPTP